MGVPRLFGGSCIRAVRVHRCRFLCKGRRRLSGLVAAVVLLVSSSSQGRHSGSTEHSSIRTTKQEQSLNALYDFLVDNGRTPTQEEMGSATAIAHPAQRAVRDFGGVVGAIEQLVDMRPPDDAVIANWLQQEMGVESWADVLKVNEQGIAVARDGTRYANVASLVGIFQQSPPNPPVAQLLATVTRQRFKTILVKLATSMTARNIVDQRGLIVPGWSIEQLSAILIDQLPRMLRVQQDLEHIREYIADQQAQSSSPYSQESLRRVAAMVESNISRYLVYWDFSLFESDEDWKLLIDAYPASRGRNKTQTKVVSSIGQTLYDWMRRQKGTDRQRIARADAIFNGIPLGFHSTDPLGPLVREGLIAPFDFHDQIEGIARSTPTTRAIVEGIARDRRQRIDLLVQHGLIDADDVDELESIARRTLEGRTVKGEIDPFIARLIGFRPHESAIRGHLYAMFENGTIPAPDVDPGAAEALAFLKHQQTIEDSPYDHQALERAIHVLEHHIRRPWQKWQFSQLERAEDWKALISALPGTRQANPNQAVENGYASLVASCRNWARKKYKGDKKRANQQIAEIFDGQAAGHFILVKNAEGKTVIIADSRIESIMFRLGIDFGMIDEEPVEGEDVHILTGNGQSSLDWKAADRLSSADHPEPILGRNARGEFVEIDPATGEVLDHRAFVDHVDSHIPLHDFGPIIAEVHQEQQNERNRKSEAEAAGEVLDFDAERVAAITTPQLRGAEVLLVNEIHQFADLFTTLARDPRVQARNPDLANWDPDRFDDELRRARLEQTDQGLSVREKVSDEVALAIVHAFIEETGALPTLASWTEEEVSTILNRSVTLPSEWVYRYRWGNMAAILAAMERTIGVSAKVRRILQEKYHLVGSFDAIPQVNEDHLVKMEGKTLVTVEGLSKWLRAEGLDMGTATVRSVIDNDTVLDETLAESRSTFQKRAVIGKAGALDVAYNAHQVKERLMSDQRWQRFVRDRATEEGIISVGDDTFATGSALMRRYNVGDKWVRYNAAKGSISIVRNRLHNGRMAKFYHLGQFDRHAAKRGVFNLGSSHADSVQQDTPLH